METLIGVLAGAVGGNVAAGLAPRLNQGAIVNSLLGLLGGGLGGAALAGTGFPAVLEGLGMGLGTFVAQVAGGGIGGGALLALVGLVRDARSK